MTDFQKEAWVSIAANPNIYGPAVSLSHRFALAGINIDHDDPAIKEILDRKID